MVPSFPEPPFCEPPFCEPPLSEPPLSEPPFPEPPSSDPPSPGPSPFGVSQVASASVTSPSTSATLRASGFTDTRSWRAVAAAVFVVVAVFDRSRVTEPTPGTSTFVVPPAERVTRLPSTETRPSTFDSATGFFPASHRAFEVTFSTSIRDSAGSPGTCTRAWARCVLPSALCSSTVASAVATSARSTRTGRSSSTPPSSTLSAVFSALAGACTSLSVASSGSWTDLLRSETSSPVRSTTALAFPWPPAGVAGAVAVAACAGTATSRATGAAATARAARRKVLLFKMVEPPQETWSHRHRPMGDIAGAGGLDSVNLYARRVN